MTDIAPDRPTAQLAGFPFYQGARCLRGHAGIRYVGNKACRDCTAQQTNGRRRNAKPETREAEAIRRAAGVGRWRTEDGVRKRDRTRQYRVRVAAAPEAIAAREARRLAQEAARIERDTLAAVKRERTAQVRAERQTPAYRAMIEARRLERDRAKVKRRKAITRGANGGTAGVADLRSILASQGGRCAYCGADGPLHLDHKRAAIQGGPHAPHNLQYLCPWHNMSKREVHDTAYRLTHGIPLITQWDGYRHRLLWLAIAVA